MKNPAKLAPFLLASLALTISLVGCGEKQDYSGSGDLDKAKTQASEAPKPTPSGAVPEAHAPMKVQQQSRPPGQ